MMKELRVKRSKMPSGILVTAVCLTSLLQTQKAEAWAWQIDYDQAIKDRDQARLERDQAINDRDSARRERDDAQKDRDRAHQSERETQNDRAEDLKKPNPAASMTIDDLQNKLRDANDRLADSGQKHGTLLAIAYAVPIGTLIAGLVCGTLMGTKTRREFHSQQESKPSQPTE